MRKADHRKEKVDIEARRGVYLSVCCAMLIVLAFASAGHAQNDEDPAPPPLRKISQEERSQLESQSDSKRRIEVALQLMSGRMKKAEDDKAAENFDSMFLELGGFHGLMDNTLDYLTRENRRTGKAFNYFKKYELGLRTFTPRLELIRRDIPVRYEPYIMRLLRYLRDARSKAIEPFFGDTVVPNKP